MSESLAEYAYNEEIAVGTLPDDATIIANSVVASPAYMLVWIAERAERRREREEATEQMVKDAEEYTGNPEDWEVRGY